MKILKQNTETALLITRSIVTSRVMMLLTRNQTDEDRIEELRKYLSKIAEAYQTDSDKYPNFKKGYSEYCFMFRFSIELLKAFRQCTIDNRKCFEVSYTSSFKHSILDPIEYRYVLSAICRLILISCNFTSFKEFCESPYPNDFDHMNEFTFIVKLC